MGRKIKNGSSSIIFANFRRFIVTFNKIWSLTRYQLTIKNHIEKLSFLFWDVTKKKETTWSPDMVILQPPNLYDPCHVHESMSNYTGTESVAFWVLA